MRRSRDSKYLKIFDEIVSKIKRGRLVVGGKVPSENELISQYTISNTTARKALLELEIRGWARRIKGRGTFVLNRKENSRLVRSISTPSAMRGGFSDNLRKDGFKPTVEVSKWELEESPAIMLGGREYQIKGKCVKFRILRYADDLLLKDEVKYINTALCHDVFKLQDLDSAIITFERRYGLKISAVNRSLTAHIQAPDAPDNKFENSEPIAIFTLYGVTLSENDDIIEIETSMYRASKYEFSIESNFNQP